MTDKKPLDDATNQGSPSDDELDTNGDGSDAEQATDEVLGETLDFANASAGRSELEQLRIKLTESENHALRTQAELDNFRKRVYRDMEVERRYAEESLLRDLLVIVDNMDRAIQAASSQVASNAQSDNSTILQGMQMVQKQFMTILDSHQCQRIEARDGPFDPNFHEAISQLPHAEIPEGHVIDVAVEGYVLHDRVLRPTQVLVSSGKP
jgi:molecular chaperone GrpE